MSPRRKFSGIQKEHAAKQIDQKVELSKAMACLVREKSYAYTQVIAEGILAEYRCKPTDKENWEVYSHLQYAIKELFRRIEQAAQLGNSQGITSGNSILAEIEKRNGRR